MAETKLTTFFTFQELAKMLIQKQGIHEGHWGVILEFAFAGGTAPFPPGSDVVVPTVIVPITKIGIQKFDEANSMTVDASQVNPVT